jgi:hypothetical protein
MRAPGEAAAHRLQHDQVAALDAPVAHRESSASGTEAAEVLAC